MPSTRCFTGRYPFSSLIVCAHCGKHYRRKITATGPVWICSTYNYKGKAACPSKQIPETTLTALTADLDIGDLTEIIAEDRNMLIFRFKDGKKAVKRWQDRSRAESWTPEMKEAARQKAIERKRYFRLLGFIWDSILYIKRCSVQVCLSKRDRDEVTKFEPQ